MPKVSVIVPTYNRAHVLPKAIQSIMDQTFQDFEILVVDDGSTDETQNITGQFGDTVRYFFKENDGVSSARNYGITRARGEYIAFLDSDDQWLSMKLALQVTYLDQHPETAMVFSDTLRFKGGEKLPLTYFQMHPPAEDHVFQHLLLYPFIPTLTVVVRKSVLDEVGYFNSKFIPCEDYDLWLRIAARFRIGYIDQPLAKYNYSPDGISQNTITVYVSINKSLESALQTYPDLASSVLEKTRRRIEHHHYFIGRYALMDGDIYLAREKMIRTILNRKWYWKAYVFYILATLQMIKKRLAKTFHFWSRMD